MGNKTKTRLMIVALGCYLIATTWLGAFIYNNYLVEGYEIAYWMTIALHHTSLYVLVSHYLIEGKD